jgi:nucleotide-binding universal stress UspA family protein
MSDSHGSRAVGNRVKLIAPRKAADESAGVAPLRLLVPVDATPRSRWGIKYVLHKHEVGTPLEVSLLHVAEPLRRPWDILRFRTEQQVAALRAEHAQYLLQDAATPLKRNDIAHYLYFREGEIIFEILDAAEQLGCDQIVMPIPPQGWQRILSGGIAAHVLRQQRTVPVVTVNRRGLPEIRSIR